MSKIKLYTVNALSGMTGFDRRTLVKILHSVKPKKTVKGAKQYELAAVQDAIAKYQAKKRGASDAKETLLRLQAEKLQCQIGMLKGEFVPKKDVEGWGAELGTAVRKVVSGIHLLAPSLVGLEVQEMDARLREVEDEVLQQLHLLDSRMDEAQTQSPEWVERFVDNSPSPKD